MREPKTLALGLAVAVALGGCALRDREWGTCAIGGAVVGAAIGGVVGGVAENNADDHPSNGERGAAIGGGLAAGALLGAIVGHAICDPEKAPPPPPPVPAPAPAALKPIVTLHGPQFDFDKATLKPAGKVLVDQAAKVMKDQPSLHVSVEGHTDSIGSEAYNQKLSERRAAAVRDYLASQGIDAARIKTRGFGKSKPVASNDTEAGRAENRRVDVLPAQ